MLSVRPHFYAGAALLALASILGMLTALRIRIVPGEAHLVALLGGLTLFAQGIGFWYMPSFAKRGILMDGIAAYAGPILFPAALVATLLRAGNARAPLLALGLLLFGIVLLASAFAGPKWRGGVPFWRTPSPHRAGDTAAALTLLSACLWLVAAGALLTVFPSTLPLLWPLALALFVLGALAHLVPRARAKPLRPALFLLGIVAAQLGGVLLLREGGRPILALLLGLPVAGAALLLPLGGKRPGVRLREARPLLLAALVVSAASLAGALGTASMPRGWAYGVYYGHLASIALALGGLSLLTLPVLFNQRPAPRYLVPSAALAIAGAALLAAGFLSPLPRWPGAALLGLALLLWLAALAPLRRPRRDCAVDRIPS